MTIAPDPGLERERLVLETLEEVLSWPPAERVGRLEVRFAQNPALLAEILELLRAAESADLSLPTALPMAAAVGVEPPPPERLGPYRVDELLGRGGMGRVYRGRRVDGVFEQAVAIKLMRRTLNSAAVAAQFARERQILADLQHPNIAQLLDGGITADGHSYIVMELLSGQPVTQYAAVRKLSLQQTLRLVLQICAAVAYAHTRLVVHADIKPNNILVTRDGNVKLLDFGVARVLAAAGAEPAANEPVGMTLEYSSPARRRGEPATTSDDVYSLGVLLDELLERFPRAAPDLRSIVARARSLAADARYASVDALGDDLQRWLDALPVQAHGTRWQYRAGRFLARHRLAAGIAGGAVLLLIGAAIALGALYVRAERARAQAEQRFADLHALSRFALFDVFDRLERVPRALTVRRDVANEAQRYLDRLAADPRAPVALRLEVIEGLRRLAQVQAAPGNASLGQVAQARANLDRADALAAALPDVPRLRIERALVRARLLLQRAVIAHSVDLDFRTAEQTLQRCRALLDRVLVEVPADARARHLDRDWSVEMASVLQWQGQYASAQRVAREALQRSMAATTDDREAVLQRSRLLDVLAESLFYAGDVAAAESPYREQLKILEQFATRSSMDVSMGRRVARAGWTLGSTLLELGRAAEAMPILVASQSQYEQLLLLDPDDRELARSLDIVINSHAQALAALRRFGEALPILTQSVDLRARLAAGDPGNASLARDQAIATAALADALADAGQLDAACRRYAEAAAAFAKIRAGGRLPDLDRDFGVRRLEQRQSRHCRRAS